MSGRFSAASWIVNVVPKAPSMTDQSKKFAIQQTGCGGCIPTKSVMTLSDYHRHVFKLSGFIAVVFVPGWILNNYFFEMGVVTPRLSFVVTYSAYALFGVVGLFFVIRQYRLRMREEPSPDKEIVREIAFLRWLVMLAFAHSLSGYILVVYVAGRWFARDVLPTLPAPNAALAGAIVTAVAGGLLFLLRWKVRSLYACLEMLTSLLLAAELAPRFQPNDPWNATFLLTFVPAAIYLFVRGADNLHQAIQKGDEDLALRALSAVGDMWQKRRENSST